MFNEDKIKTLNFSIAELDINLSYISDEAIHEGYGQCPLHSAHNKPHAPTLEPIAA